MDPSRLLTRSLRQHPQGHVVARILARALAAVEPGEAVARTMRREGNQLYVDGQRYKLTAYDRVLLVSVGKAAVPMAQSAAAILGERLSGGLVVTKEGQLGPEIRDWGGESGSIAEQGEAQRVSQPPISNLQSISNLQFFEAGHPIPDERGVAAARQVAQLLEAAGERDLVLALISGGGSALLPLPVAGVSLGEIQALTGMLLASGATINEMNALRKHLEQLKGGGMARMAAPAALATLVLSDVVGSPLDVIASGPTVPDNTSFGDALAVLERYDLLERAPAPIGAHLRAGVAGQVADTPKPGERVFERVQTVVVGSNLLAAEAALNEARAQGLNAALLSTYVQGEAREVGRVLAAIAREIDASGQPLARPACLVAGGETTVTLRGGGRGGRNQELALAAVPELAGLRDTLLVALATDGGDGPTDAAGAVASGATHSEALAAGLSVERALAQNDAYPFFAALGDLLLPGPTATNVNDLAFVFVW
jgi:hydroxypyruvate reductase